ncbi:MAG: hypothetical protein ACRC2T_11950 [Thermoguttaceae bacterium]
MKNFAYLFWICFISFGMLCHATYSAEIIPCDVSEFYVVPEKSSIIHWETKTPLTNEQLAFVISDVNGQTVSRGIAKIDAKKLNAEVQLPKGYWEITFESIGNRFGIVSLEKASEPFDNFFAIDGALSWLVTGDKLREDIIKSVKRSGIGMVRERFRLQDIAPADGEFNWSPPTHDDLLRQTYKKHGIEVLEMSHDTPDWMGKVGTYPKNLKNYADAWKHIASQWQGTWGAVEVWNEPDIFFGGDLPADQYVPLVKTLAYRFQKDNVTKPLVGGVVANYNKEWHKTAADNKLLDYIDVYSFHTYDRAPNMENIAKQYRYWLRDNGYANMPLWLTECGRPWKKGVDRPPVEQDLESVTDIVMKGVESKCCGIDRYFPFVLPYYEENDNNFGMLDKKGTPLRSMAGYSQMVKALAHLDYVGDLKPEAFAIEGSDSPQVVRARVFSGKNKETPHVIVLYTGNMTPSKLTMKFPIRKAESVTGEPVSTESLQITNGLTYFFADVPKEMIDMQTDANELLNYTKEPFVRKHKKIVPFVMTFDFDKLKANSAGYIVDAEEEAKNNNVLRIPLVKHDLSDSKRGVINHLIDVAISPSSLAEYATVFKQIQFACKNSTNKINFVSIPDKSEQTNRNEFIVILPDDMVETEKILLDFTAVTEPPQTSSHPPFVGDTLNICLMQEATFKNLLAWNPDNTRIQNNPADWLKGCSANGVLKIDAGENTSVIFDCNFTEGDKWCYPKFMIPNDLQLKDCKGVIIRGRATGETTPSFFLFEKGTEAGYLTPKPLFPADGKWHAVKILFSDLQHCSATPMDKNGKLDIEEVECVSAGFNTKSEKGTLEISDFLFFR